MKRLVISMLIAVSTVSLSSAQLDGTWISDANGFWSTNSNWAGGVVPSVGKIDGVKTGGVAYFTNSPTSSDIAVNVGADNQSIGKVALGNTGQYGYLFQSDGGKLVIDAAYPPTGSTNGIHVLSTAGDNVNTFEGDIQLKGNGEKTFSFRNDSASSKLEIKGDIGNLGVNQVYTLYLEGDGDALSEIRGDIKAPNDPVNESIAVVKRGSGKWSLSGNNAFNGGLTVEEGTIRYFGEGDTVFGSGLVTIKDGVSFQKANGSNVLIDNDMEVQGDFTFFGTSDGNDWSGDMDLTGGDRTLTVDADLTLSGTISNGALTKAGSETLTLDGVGIYTGGVTIEDGLLVINGDHSAATGAITVNAGAALGGDGLLGGDVVLADGAGFNFSASDTLTVNASSVDLGNLSVAALFGLDSSVADGTYTLMDGTATFDFSSVQNLGLENAYDLGDGKSAYFEEGSLNLVVIPEPATLGLVLAMGGGILWVRRWFMI